METLSPIDLKFRLSEPTWHGHSQAFYRLRDASPYLVVMKHTSLDKFLEPEVHGQAVFYIDRCYLSHAVAHPLRSQPLQLPHAL